MIEFTIPGAPVGKGRPRFQRRGNSVHTYTPEKTASYENLVRLYANQAMAGKPLYECALSVYISLSVTVPESWSRKKKEMALIANQVYPTTKPDIDNVIKILFDSMNGIVYKDDKQIVYCAVSKEYSAVAQAHVFLKEFTGIFESTF